MKWAVPAKLFAIVIAMALSASGTVHALPGTDVTCTYSRGRSLEPTDRLVESLDAQVRRCIADLDGLVRLIDGQFVVQVNDAVEARLRRSEYFTSQPVFYDHARRLLYFERRSMHFAIHVVVDMSNGGTTEILSLPQYSPDGRWGMSREYEGYPPARNGFVIVDFSHHPPRLAFEFNQSKLPADDRVRDQLTLTTPVWEGNDRVRFDLQAFEQDSKRQPFEYRSAVVERKGDAWQLRLDRNRPAWSPKVIVRDNSPPP